jgi:sarcosine oxidase subunit alpha
MASQPWRLASGGAIDRTRTLRFTFDGRELQGHPGDTLASALLANGVRLVARSFKYHRPRGIFGCGPEEPNALVRLRRAGRAEPNTRSTMIELFEGLEAESQNRHPSLEFDFAAVGQWLAPLTPPGFYYKTFMWPRGGWPFYGHWLRRLGGMGTAGRLPDPDRYDQRYAHCDVLVVGSGPAGLAAAQAALGAGASVMLVDERDALGGHLLHAQARIDGAPASKWIAASEARLAAHPKVRILRRATAFGCYDHGHVALLERVADHLPAPRPNQPRQRLWNVRARRIVVAAGAIERPIVFNDNDRPGIMLASAARAYVNRYAVAPGRNPIVYTNNDSAYAAALDLARVGIRVRALLDSRAAVAPRLSAAMQQAGIELRTGCVVSGVRGARAVEDVLLDGGKSLDCDALFVSGGWNPSVHLLCHLGARPRYDEAIHSVKPATLPPGFHVAGGAAGSLSLARTLDGGWRAGREAAAACGCTDESGTAPRTEAEEPCGAEPLWDIPRAARDGKAFVDLQNDVTYRDIELAHRENFRSVEHLKRLTALGMGTDQGKTSNVNGLAIMARLRGEAIDAVGTTAFRPPYTPVAFGALAGRERGEHLIPVRRTPLHAWHLAHGALMTSAGHWMRPRAYLRPGESFDGAWQRETRAVRGAVGICDVSTLGKIDVQGPDALELLERVYCNGLRSLQVGRARYGLMLREDGMVLDDGTTSRIGEQHYFITTTTANAARVLQHLEYYAQMVWPELRVHVASVSDQWGQIAAAGPRSRDLLARVVSRGQVDEAALPFLGVVDAAIGPVPVRIFRISYSGELAYEIAVPSRNTETVWSALLGAGLEVTPYGLEALGTLRIEKGHVAGGELDGRTTPADLGLGRMVSRTKRFVGARMLGRVALADPQRRALVGLEPLDGKSLIRAGAQLVEPGERTPPVAMLGHVSSATYSPTLGRPIALGLLAGAASRMGRTLVAAAPLLNEAVEVKVVSPAFYDPEGLRMKPT